MEDLFSLRDLPISDRLSNIEVKLKIKEKRWSIGQRILYIEERLKMDSTTEIPVILAYLPRSWKKRLDCIENQMMTYCVRTCENQMMTYCSRRCAGLKCDKLEYL
jgi:hypothetical protein